MRTCKYCRNRTKGRCRYCGYENKKSSAETIFKRIIVYHKFLYKEYKDELNLRKKLWEIFKPLLNISQKEYLSKRGF